MMENNVLTPEVLDFLPEPFQVAQKAIDLPEVQEMMAKLAKYNLGVFMPHQHNAESGAFEVLEEGKMQMENDLQISFMTKDEAAKINSLPVGWVWKNDGVQGSAECTFGCHWEISPTTGAAVHIKNHK